MKKMVGFLKWLFTTEYPPSCRDCGYSTEMFERDGRCALCAIQTAFVQPEQESK